MFKWHAIGVIRQKLPRDLRGFTIIEVMIFLAVSIIIFSAAVVTINRQNSRTAFAQSARDVEIQIQDTFNDVENGYYPSNNNFTCTYNGDNPSINQTDTNANEQGTNENCIFIGKALQFGRNGNNDQIVTSTIVGKRLDGDKDVTRIQDASPTLLEEFVGNKDVYKINSEVEIKGLYFNNFPFGFFSGVVVLSGFAQESSGTLKSGIVRPTVSPIGFSGVGTYDSDFLGYISSLNSSSLDNNIAKSGATLCLQEKGGGRVAEIKIGVESQRLATSSIIDPGSGVCA